MASRRRPRTPAPPAFAVAFAPTATRLGRAAVCLAPRRCCASGRQRAPAMATNGEVGEREAVVHGDERVEGKSGEMQLQADDLQMKAEELPLKAEGEEDDGPELGVLIAGGFIGLVVLLVAVGTISGGFSTETFIRVTEWFQGLGPGGIFVYGALYFVLEVVALPATPLTIAAGYLFGVPEGTACVSVASTLAAGASFLIARYGLRDYISKLARQYPKFLAFDSAIGREGLKFVFLLRLSPLLPFALSNYLYGLTSVKFSDYLLASWAGMLPGTFAYISAGGALGSLLDISEQPGKISPYLIALGVGATIVVITAIGKLASDAINETVEPEGGGGGPV